MNKKELKKFENKLVVKSNDLVQRNRFNLTSQEQKLVLFAVSQISNNTLKPMSFRIRDVCKILGIQPNGQQLRQFKDTILKVQGKNFWLKAVDGSTVTCSWISKARISPDGEVVEITLDEDLKPYILDLRKRFVKYKLINTIPMHSTYSIRLYEILKSYENLGKVKISLDQLKYNLFLGGKYERFNNFRQIVLEVATREINEFTDIFVDYEPIREGHKVTEIDFVIYKNDIKKINGPIDDK